MSLEYTKQSYIDLYKLQFYINISLKIQTIICVTDKVAQRSLNIRKKVLRKSLFFSWSCRNTKNPGYLCVDMLREWTKIDLFICFLFILSIFKL